MARARGHSPSRRGALPLRERASLVQTFPDALAAIDGDGRIVFVNPAFENLVGVSAAQALGRGLATFLLDEQPVPTAGSSLVRLRHPDGRSLLVEMSFGHALAARGGRHLLAVVFRDGQDRAERDAARAESTAARRRQTLLAEASAILSSGRGTTTFPALANAIACAYAGACSIDLTQRDGTLRCEALAQVGDVEPPREDELAVSLAEALRTGRTHLNVRSLEHGGGFLVAAPLSWASRTLGVLTCATGEAISEEDLAVTEQLARQAALSMAQADLLAHALSRIGQGSLVLDRRPPAPLAPTAARRPIKSIGSC